MPSTCVEKGGNPLLCKRSCWLCRLNELKAAALFSTIRVQWRMSEGERARRAYWQALACASENGKNESGGFVCLPAWSAALRVSHIERLCGRRKAYTWLYESQLAMKTGASCMLGGAKICRVHWQQPCSVSVSKGTIGWLVLNVASQSGSVDNAFAGKRVELPTPCKCSPCAQCLGLK